MISTKYLLRISAIFIFSVASFALRQVSAQQPAKSDPSVKSGSDGANGMTPYTTIPLDAAQQVLAKAQEIGRLNGDTYYFIGSSAPGVGQIIRVKTTDHTKYSVVGVLINNGKATISNPAEKAAFEQVENNMTVGQARALGLSGGSDVSGQNAHSVQAAGAKSPEPVVTNKDGGVIEVTLMGYTVDFHDSGDDIVVSKIGATKIGEMQYVAAMHGDAAQKAKSVGRVAGNVVMSSVTGGYSRMTSINPNSTAITVYGVGGQEWMYNSDIFFQGKQGPPPSFVVIAIKAEDEIRKQKPDFKIPNDKNLRLLAERVTPAMLGATSANE